MYNLYYYITLYFDNFIHYNIIVQVRLPVLN